ncbi:MAG: circularly permuted type 2 ATP-grasp protein [Gammaproteobacteria bacterium]|nr:circularly permuted type 2 ATP-grasp protein [Gammaproteobacteria bacterium]
MSIDFTNYGPLDGYDEFISKKGNPRRIARQVCRYFSGLTSEEVQELKQASDLAIKALGISFTVYSEGSNIDRAWPMDLIPRLIASKDWKVTETGLKQRLKALNMFINDLYHEQQVVKDGVFSGEVLAGARNYRKQCEGISPPFGVWAHICGTDLVRGGDGTQYVLEDNLRVPSGVSYMLENRHVMKRVFPELFEHIEILPIDDYTTKLFEMLAALSPRQGDTPEVVVLTPGIYNSAYFEHSYLAQQMGAELVQGCDLLVAADDCVYMKTIYGPKRVDVIYRRIDDDFLDPEVFRKDSTLGVPGLMRAWRKGNVGIANAPGAGVADDKVVYYFVPELIRYYLNEEPIIPNVPTYLCMREDDRSYVLDHLDELVVKPANESGGYGMLVGPKATKKQLKQFAKLIEEDPRNYIAQPTLHLSTVPTLIENGRVGPRHVDLRPFTLQSKGFYTTMGGLSRVALPEGSLVVNSSQGGGSKDTWVIDLEDAK